MSADVLNWHRSAMKNSRESRCFIVHWISSKPAKMPKPGITGTTDEEEILGMLKDIEKAETAH
jgi:hypothetical protein